MYIREVTLTTGGGTTKSVGGHKLMVTFYGGITKKFDVAKWGDRKISGPPNRGEHN